MATTALRNSPLHRPNYWLSYYWRDVTFSGDGLRDRVCIISESCSISKRTKGVSGFRRVASERFDDPLAAS